MSVVHETKKESFKFSGLPLYLKDLILQKMNFKSYSTFVRTGTEAESLNVRNDKFKYLLPVHRITIGGNHVSFIDKRRIVVVPFENCKKIRMRPSIITVHDDSLNNKTCDFLLEFDKIQILECPYPNGEIPYITELFKKAKIHTLKMSIVGYENHEFSYDTSEIENFQIEIHNRKLTTPHNMLSIKAQRSLSLKSVWVTRRQFYEYLLKILNGTKMPDLILENCTAYQAVWDDIMDLIISHGKLEGESTYAFLDRTSSFKVEILSFSFPYSLKIRVL